jgi:sulfur carrier protein ThiS
MDAAGFGSDMGDSSRELAASSRAGKVRRLETQPSPGIRIDAASVPAEEYGRAFLELRRKVRDSEMLSSSTERLLADVGFTGRLSIVVQNGRVLKSGYEEGYFNRRRDVRLVR